MLLNRQNKTDNMAKIPESRVIDFIAAVEAEPGIWNHRSKSYSQNRKKYLTKLAQQFNTTRECGTKQSNSQ